jgi:hypothetical protein
MEKSQQTGLVIMIASAFTLVLFLWASMRRSYMAIALPVMSALAVVSALAFWIGWTMFTGEEEDEAPGDEDAAAEEPAS